MHGHDERRVDAKTGFSEAYTRALQEISFQQAWEMEGKSMKLYSQKDSELQVSRRGKIAKYVAYTKEVGGRVRFPGFANDFFRSGAC